MSGNVEMLGNLGDVGNVEGCLKCWDHQGVQVLGADRRGKLEREEKRKEEEKRREENRNLRRSRNIRE
jgi:hypothetical protein